MKKSVVLLIFCLLIGLMGCNAGAETAVSQLPSPTPVMMDTAVPPTLTPTATPLPATSTPIPPTLTPTVTATPSPTATPNFNCPQPGGNPILEKSVDFSEFSEKLVGYLNAGGNIEQLPELLDSMDISNEVFLVDMNNDTVLELVLNVAVPIPEESYLYDYGTTLLQCRNGSFEKIYYSWLGNYSFFRYTFSDDVDNDGNQDVIIVGGVGGSACNLVPAVLIWSGDSIIDASPDYRELELGCSQEDIVLTEDIDGDGVKELIVSGWTVGHLSYAPPRTITQTFSLQAKTYQLQITEYGPPELLVYTINDAQQALDSDDMALAVLLYEDIAQNQTTQTIPSYNLPLPQQVENYETEVDRAKGYQQAFALFRLAGLQTVLGNTEEVEWALAQLQAQFPEGSPGFEFNALALLLVDSLQQGRTPKFSCEIVTREIEKSYPDLSFHFYWGLNIAAYWTETICPFSEP